MKKITQEDQLHELTLACRELLLAERDRSAQVAALTAMCKALCMTHPNKAQALAVFRQAQMEWEKPGREDLLLYWRQLSE